MKDNILYGKFITLAVTGGIAAYKTPILVRRLKEKGAIVQVVITENAKNFVTPLALETVSNNKVIDSMFNQGDNIKVEHIDIADKSDFIVIAPATANVIGKVANGIGDDFLTSMLLAYTKKLLFVPAMNVNMYANPIVQKNMKFLASFDNIEFMDADIGNLACGYEGKGRMPDPDLIVKEIEYQLSPKPLKNKKILITAGATREYIDPVRFISNPSTGKMGFALAKQATMLGADVTLLTNKGCLELPYRLKNAEYFTDVESLKELVYKFIDSHDLIIMSAAVGDIKIKKYNPNKTKKTNGSWDFEFTTTTDILSSIKDKNIFKIGFAAESNDHNVNAISKLKNKGLNMVVLNDISRKDIGFMSDYNQITIFSNNGEQKNFDKLTKENVAQIILEEYINY
jgi:phosphopantothenoylcysteine decarboxylase/phosphopantothenate--cysteine ligase